MSQRGNIAGVVRLTATPTIERTHLSWSPSSDRVRMTRHIEGWIVGTHGNPINTRVVGAMVKRIVFSNMTTADPTQSD